MTEPFVSSYDLAFTVVPPEEAPALPASRGARESPIRSALKALPRGGFMFVAGNDLATRKRVTDMCTRIRQVTKYKEFAIRTCTHNRYGGIGVWRVDEPLTTGRATAKTIESTEIPQPTKSQLMAGK